jgi:translation initiation factor 2 beta subunit (eIF-2beta)/eIF-5
MIVCVVFYMPYISSSILSYNALMKVCPSCPSSEDHYILREIMF